MKLPRREKSGQNGRAGGQTGRAVPGSRGIRRLLLRAAHSPRPRPDRCREPPMTRSEFLPFYVPDVGEEEIREVTAALRSGWLTTGPRAQRFEVEFAAVLWA